MSDDYISVTSKSFATLRLCVSFFQQTHPSPAKGLIFKQRSPKDALAPSIPDPKPNGIITPFLCNPGKNLSIYVKNNTAQLEVNSVMDGKIENLFLKVGHGEPMSPVRELSADSGKGIVGDRSYGRKKRQVLLIEKEILDEFSLDPGWVRENITVSNISLTGLDPGRLLQAGGVSLEITGDCAPCQLIDDIKPGLRAEMEQRRGILCIVKDGGKMQVGDQVRLIS